MYYFILSINLLLIILGYALGFSESLIIMCLLSFNISSLRGSLTVCIILRFTNAVFYVPLSGFCSGYKALYK